jgi:uncharacterized membrane protein
MTINGNRSSGIFLAAVLAVGGCGDDAADDDGTDTGSADAGACADLTYASFGNDFMDKYCASCHAASVKGSARMGAPGDDVYDTLAQIKADKKDLKHEVSSKAMPFPTAKVFPSQAERDQFVQWIDCGPN